MNSLKQVIEKADNFIATGGRWNFWIGVSAGILALCLLVPASGCSHNQCRADGKLPPDATFDELRDLKREHCQ